MRPETAASLAAKYAQLAAFASARAKIAKSPGGEYYWLCEAASCAAEAQECADSIPPEHELYAQAQAAALAAVVR